MLKIILENVLEAIYFALFLIYGKQLKEKRILFITIMVFEYLMITQLIKFDIWIHVLYIALTFIDLKVIYREKAQITDIFLFASASIMLIFISIISGLPQIFFKIKYQYLLILNRIIMFTSLFLLRKKINKIYSKYISFWNRKKSGETTKIKSLTIRNISVIIFNLMFYIINIGLMYAILTKK